MKAQLRKLLNPHGKLTFVKETIPQHGKVLDVGCGNNSPEKIKTIRPDVHYVGLDVGIYNQSSNPSNYADEFILTSPEDFHLCIEQRRSEFDAIISEHNLEHCNNSKKVLSAMLQALKPKGYLYLSFPCEQSVDFQSRSGILNFYDDKTHNAPISYSLTMATLKEAGLTIKFTRQRYRPFIPFCIGLLLEPICYIAKKTAPLGSTWALYGFGTVIIAQK